MLEDEEVVIMPGDVAEKEVVIAEPEEEEPHKKRTPVVIKIPRREDSVRIPPRKVLFMTAGMKPKVVKLRECLYSPLTLYELCAAAVDKLAYPLPFEWNEAQVAEWLGEVVGLPQYKECITDNHINGKRLLRLEDPSVLPEINIHDFEHIKQITAAIRKVFSTDYVLFARSIGLPFREQLTFCTWFKSRTGPNGGIRDTWTRSDILRWMKIIMPKPLHLDHWDLVWYLQPDWPKQMVGTIPKADLPKEQTYIPHYKPTDEEIRNQDLEQRNLIILHDIPSEDQHMWLEHPPGSPSRVEVEKKIEKEIKYQEYKKRKAPKSRLVPKTISLTGLAGKDLILARRKMPKPKFFLDYPRWDHGSRN